MELKLKIGYLELMELIKQLPAFEVTKLRQELSKLPFDTKPEQQENDGFTKLLLSGPVMSDEQHEQFLTNRKYFNAWRTN